MNYTSTKNLKKFGDRVYFTPAYEDRIYRVFPDSVQFMYQLDFGDRALPIPEKYQQINDKQFESLLRKSHTFDGYFIDLNTWLALKSADDFKGRTFFLLIFDLNGDPEMHRADI